MCQPFPCPPTRHLPRSYLYHTPHLLTCELSMFTRLSSPEPGDNLGQDQGLAWVWYTVGMSDDSRGATLEEGPKAGTRKVAAFSNSADLEV